MLRERFAFCLLIQYSGSALRKIALSKIVRSLSRGISANSIVVDNIVAPNNI